MWGALAAVVKGLAGAFFQWYATYDQGRQAQRTKNLEASLQLQQKVDEAAHGPERRIDLEWLQRGSGRDQAAARPSAPEPPAPDQPTQP